MAELRTKDLRADLIRKTNQCTIQVLNTAPRHITSVPGIPVLAARRNLAAVSLGLQSLGVAKMRKERQGTSVPRGGCEQAGARRGSEGVRGRGTADWPWRSTVMCYESREFHSPTGRFGRSFFRLSVPPTPLPRTSPRIHNDHTSPYVYTCD